MRDQRGSVSIFSLFLIIMLLVFMAYVADIARLQAVKVHARHSLNLALRAASAEIDMEAFTDAENPKLIIVEPEAMVTFDQVLRDNLRLDLNYQPYTNSVADEKVEVCYFKVIELPYSYSFKNYSETINQVSCTGIIKVPVRLSPFARFLTGLPEYSELYIHSTVGPDLFLKN